MSMLKYFYEKNEEDEDLEVSAVNVLNQIEEKQYKQELIDKGVKDIIELGIAFAGKKVLIKSPSAVLKY